MKRSTIILIALLIRVSCYAGQPAISYPVNNSPSSTDYVLGVVDPSDPDNWALNLFPIANLLTALEAALGTAAQRDAATVVNPGTNDTELVPVGPLKTWIDAYAVSQGWGSGGGIPPATFTQNYTFIMGTGAGTYAEMPIGTIEGGTNPTSDSNKIVHDYSAAQLVYGSSGLYALSPWAQQDFTFENLAADDDNYRFFTAAEPLTILAIGVYCRGTCTTPAQISLKDSAGNAMTHTTPTAATGTDNITFQSITAGGGLVKGEGMALDVVNSVSPETDEYTITIKYRYDRQ